jgi:hypothetical protein
MNVAQKHLINGRTRAGLQASREALVVQQGVYQTAKRKFDAAALQER